MRSESVKSTVLHVEREDTDTLPILHEKVEGEVLDEKIGIMSKGLTVKGMKDRVTSPIGSSGTSVGLTAFSKFEGLTTEGSLVDLALFGPRERYTEVFKLKRRGSDEFRQLSRKGKEAHLDNGIRCFSTHVVNRILIS